MSFWHYPQLVIAVGGLFLILVISAMQSASTNKEILKELKEPKKEIKVPLVTEFKHEDHSYLYMVDPNGNTSIIHNPKCTHNKLEGN